MRDRLAAGRAEYGDLADDGDDLALRAMARLGTDDPSIALLDAWAVVTDTVAFYSERIANEGFLRTATQRRSVRELARTLGYELRPGVAAQVDLVFTVEIGARRPAGRHRPGRDARAVRARARAAPADVRDRRRAGGARGVECACRSWTRGRRCRAPPRAGSGCAGPGRAVRPGDAILVERRVRDRPG